MKKKLLVVFAHPDDEAFGPGGTLAKYGHENVEIHLLLATRGEAGDNHLRIKKNKTLGEIREKEARKSTKILGIKRVEFLGFIDSELKQSNYHQLAEKIMAKIKSFKPEVILTDEPRGISGHLDHVAVSLTTTYAFLKTKIAKRLYYYCLPEKWYSKRLENYFIYFPEGFSEKAITTRILTSKYWEVKVKAMMAHQSQIRDVKAILKERSKLPRIESFIRQYPKPKGIIRETSLF